MDAFGWKKWGDRLLSVAFVVCVMLVVWLLLQVTTITSFRVPSYSMYPTLIPGDHILVNKWIVGARIFDVWDMAEGKEVEIYRLPGVREVKRNDVLVFHNPYPYSVDTLSMHLLKYYVKRCIAIPGDTMEIVQGRYYIKGTDEPVGNVEAQKQMGKFRKEDARNIMNHTYPMDKYINWTVLDFGPLQVPAKGQTIAMDSTSMKLYRKLIEWEQKKSLTRDVNNVYIGDSLIKEYRFEENYYFVGGDFMGNSEDSRTWGLLPESYIVGVATHIWKSVDKITGEMRWDRVMKKIE